MRVPRQHSPVSTWQLAAGGLQRKWQGLKQRTAWRFRTLQNKDTAIVVSAADQAKERELHLKTRGGRNADDPLACHSVLARVSSESLNGILSATSPQISSQYCKTMMGFMLHACQPAMRAKILEVVAYQRVGEITIANRALIIRAIQRCLLSPLHTQKAVLYAAASNILRSTFGTELSLLKEHIHSDDEYLIEEHADAELKALSESNQRQQTESGATTAHTSGVDGAISSEMDLPHSGDLSRLIFGNKNVTEVVQVMQHIAIEALKVKEEHPDLVKIVSDIDDTLFPGWLDQRYPLHVPYPGVWELYGRLSHGFAVDGKSDKHAPSIAFLTARPRGWLSMGRYLTVQHLRSLGIPNATVLSGSMKGLVRSKKIADVKQDNFTRFAALFPEFKFVFFGDSGQGDALLASRLLQLYPDQVLATLIHDVTPHSDQAGDGTSKAVYKDQGISFFSTYPDAALITHDKGLLAAEDVYAVLSSAQQDLEASVFVGVNAATAKQERRAEMDKARRAIESSVAPRR